MVGSGGEEGAHGVLAEGIVISKRVLRLPLVGAVCALVKRVGTVRLAHLVATW